MQRRTAKIKSDRLWMRSEHSRSLLVSLAALSDLFDGFGGGVAGAAEVGVGG
jgi:hypothetical protein